MVNDLLLAKILPNLTEINPR